MIWVRIPRKNNCHYVWMLQAKDTLPDAPNEAVAASADFDLADEQKKVDATGFGFQGIKLGGLGGNRTPDLTVLNDLVVVLLGGLLSVGLLSPDERLWYCIPLLATRPLTMRLALPLLPMLSTLLLPTQLHILTDSNDAFTEDSFPSWISTTGWEENNVDPCACESTLCEEVWYGITCEDDLITEIELFTNLLLGEWLGGLLSNGLLIGLLNGVCTVLGELLDSLVEW